MQAKNFAKLVLKGIGFAFLFTAYLSIYIPVWLFSKLYASFTSKESLFDIFLPLDTKATRDRKREELESREGITNPLNKLFIFCFNRLKKW